MVALLCGPAPEGYTRWSVRLVADRCVQVEGPVAVCRETVRRTLTNKRAHAVAANGMVPSCRAAWGVCCAQGRRA